MKWYDGYRSHPDSEKVINPVSFGLCSEDGEFQNYWSMTALTTFLVDALKKRPLNFAKVEIDQRTLEAYEPERPPRPKKTTIADVKVVQRLELPTPTTYIHP